MQTITMDGINSQEDIEMFSEEQAEFLCPGETLPISNSLHLARLAAGYSACNQCDHRCETKTLPQDVIKSINRFFPETNNQQNHQQNIRGVYLNEFTRPKIENIVEHILELHLADSQLSSPRILVAHDWRPSSPDLAIGVVATLRRWGCEIVDLGQVNRACFDYGMLLFPADLGLFVTGGREAEKINGLDILASNGVEWSHPGRLSPLWSRLEKPTSRTRRNSGSFQSIAILENYETQIETKFPEISPLRIALACGEPATLQLLGAILLKHGCEVNFQDLNFSAADFKKQVESFRYSIRDAHVDLGILIRPDGQSVLVFDERGRRLDRSMLLNLVNPDGETVLTCPPLPEGQSQHSIEQLLTEFKESQAAIAIEGDQRYWFTNAKPMCDAIHLVGRILHSLSNCEWPISVLCQQQQLP